VQGLVILGQIAREKRATLVIFFNSDLCDLAKIGQIKNLGFISCMVIRCTYNKNLVQAGMHFKGFFQFQPPGGDPENWIGVQSVLQRHMAYIGVCQ